MNIDSVAKLLRLTLERVARWLAIAGGVVTLGSALLVTVSVVGRWRFNAPVPGDYELVEIGVAISVFAYLSYTQLKNGHITVDTFTSWLPSSVNNLIDALWGLVLAAFLGFFTWGLITGGLNARAANETLVQLTWPIWPVYMISALLCGLACFVTLATAIIRIGHRA